MLKLPKRKRKVLLSLADLFQQLSPVQPTHILSLFFSSPEHEVLMVSCCGQSMSVVSRPSAVVRAASRTALKAYSSCIPGTFDWVLGKKHLGDL